MIKEIIKNIEKCDDFHDRCDYLLEHDEATYLIEYINKLKQENEKLNHYKKLYQILKREKEGLRSWLVENIEHTEWTSLNEDYLTGLQDILSKLNELEDENAKDKRMVE